MSKQFWQSGLAAILAGLSLSAAFAATGFIAALGREQFLGIHQNDWSAETLSLLAGRCIADSFFMVLSFVFGFPGFVIICALLAAVVAALVVSRHVSSRQWLPAAVESFIAAAITVILSIVILHFEAPTIPLRGWLIAPDLESPIDKAICDLSPHREKCAIVGSTAAAPLVTKLGTISQTDQDLRKVDNPGILLLESSSAQAGLLLKDYNFTNPLEPAKALRRLHDRYSFLVIVSLFPLFLLSFFTWHSELSVWKNVLIATRTALIVESTLSTVMIPYVYGKLVDPAVFPNAHLQYLEDRPTVTSDSLKEITGGSPFSHGGSFPVVSHSDKSLSVISIDLGSGVTKLLEIPRDKIVSIDYSADVDVLAKISECRKGVKGVQCQPKAK